MTSLMLVTFYSKIYICRYVGHKTKQEHNVKIQNSIFNYVIKSFKRCVRDHHLGV